jgi:hypothetical protein
MKLREQIVEQKETALKIHIILNPLAESYQNSGFLQLSLFSQLIKANLTSPKLYFPI